MRSCNLDSNVGGYLVEIAYAASKKKNVEYYATMGAAYHSDKRNCQ